MKPENVQFQLIDVERNVYEIAQLYPQCRLPIEDYINLLSVPGSSEAINVDGDKLKSVKGDMFKLHDGIANFIASPDKTSEWGVLNKQFLSYHKSLTAYTLLNSMPIMNYLGLKSGVSSFKDMTIVDVGGGTGHAYCSFFNYPETIKYILVDPNVRELHDQFLRLYPKLSWLNMGHVIAYAEALPFKSNSVDMVMSISSIDHFKDYEKFVSEAYRILKPGGYLFISSHLDLPNPPTPELSITRKIFSPSLLERLARFLYFRKNRVGSDDHTYHFANTEPFENAMNSVGISVAKSEIFKQYFYVLGKKP